MAVPIKFKIVNPNNISVPKSTPHFTKNLGRYKSVTDKLKFIRAMIDENVLLEFAILSFVFLFSLSNVVSSNTILF